MMITLKCDLQSLLLTRFPFDLAWLSSFWPKVPSLELDLEIIKTNILNKTYDDYFKNVISNM